jgi:uncharacterized protein YbaR (Trm112 family)
MKTHLLNLLICPDCVPGEVPLKEETSSIDGDDILEGRLNCRRCGASYPITGGVARLLPRTFPSEALDGNRYETDPMVSSYLWSHYGDLMCDRRSSSTPKWPV